MSVKMLYPGLRYLKFLIDIDQPLLDVGPFYTVIKRVTSRDMNEKRSLVTKYQRRETKKHEYIFFSF